MKKIELKTATKEIRQVTSEITLRSLDDNETSQEVIEGYALKFNRESEILGGWIRFREKLDSTCLDKTDVENVVALFNHDESKVLGRTSVNLELEVDNIGLKFRVKPTDTSYSRDLLENIRSGIINQCSFAFTVADEEDAEVWEESPEENVDYIRTIRNIDKLYDVSIVTTPAYPDTEAVVGARSAEKLKLMLEQRDKQLNKENDLSLLILESEAYSI